MKMSKKIAVRAGKWMTGLSGSLLACSVFAEDKLASGLTGEVREILGSEGSFWKYFIVASIMIAGAGYLTTKNPMTFVMVLVTAFLPGLLLKAFVF